ncbi:MAG: hypothetical protein K1000chlam2_00180 [Chlamydiae bacterium]|nr:hypothetical protein [Chlamydiota bacterium]
MSTIASNLTTLSLDTKREIIQHLDLRSLAALGQTDKLFKILTDSQLSKFIQAIQCPPSQESPIQQIKSHVEELYAKADQLKDNRIQHLLTQPKTLENVSLLQKFLKARDILILWSKILPNAPMLDQLKTCDAVIENADGFSDTFNQNKQQLIANTTFLDLQGIYFDDRAAPHKLTHIPSELFELSQLKFLDLRNNLLTEIPDEIGNLTNLQHLALCRNSLKTLPSKIVILKTLNNLILRHNKLESLPLGMTSLTLNILNLKHNQLSFLPNDFHNISCAYLDITNNQFSSIPRFPNAMKLLCNSNLLPLTTQAAKVCNDNRKKIIAGGKAIIAIAALGLAYYNIGLICPSLFN